MAPFPQTTLPAHLRHPGGRPSEYRPEYCEAVIENAKTQGLSLVAFAGVIGVAADTVYEWRKAHREFSEACARAKAARVLWWELKMAKARKGAEVTASMFALKNAAPGEWRDMKYTQHTHQLDFKKLSESQLQAIAAGADPADAGVIEGECERIEPATS